MRVLFVGLAESSHSISWIELLRGSDLSFRLFALPSGEPPRGWDVPTYVTMRTQRPGRDPARRHLYPSARALQLPLKAYERLVRKDDLHLAHRWLARIVRQWRPHVVHTFGIDPGSEFFLETLRRAHPGGAWRWVVQVRGGPDLALRRVLPEYREKIRAVFLACDQVIADNRLNYDYAVELGCDPAKLSKLGPIPGSGGLDVARCRGSRTVPAVASRLIVWPKAYDCPQSKAGSVLEALRLAAPRLGPCAIEMLVTDEETRMWLETLPEEVRSLCRTRGRIPRAEALDLLARARVLLAPSLLDGVPNVLLEAMAYGALPIVSPLPTLDGIIEEGRHALLARNLYPQEIADALVRAMTDDRLVERAARENQELVSQIADRSVIGSRVVAYYRNLASALPREHA